MKKFDPLPIPFLSVPILLLLIANGIGTRCRYLDVFPSYSYSDVFKGEGKLEGQLYLELDESVQPVQLSPRDVPLAVNRHHTVKPKTCKRLTCDGK